MLVKNISARFHHVGEVSIAPGESAEVSDAYKGSLNESDLQIVVAHPKQSKESKKSQLVESDKTA